MPKSLSTGGFKWLNPAKLNLDKYDNNSSRSCTLEVHLEYSKELHELHNDYPLPQDKLEITREILSDYKPKTADYNISISNVKKLVFNFLIKEKYVFHYKNLQL